MTTLLTIVKCPDAASSAMGSAMDLVMAMTVGNYAEAAVNLVNLVAWATSAANLGE